MKTLLLTFIGGGIGASARYWLSGLMYRLIPTGFPIGTLTVNLLGSFLLGLVMELLANRFVADPTLRVFLCIGILGGFTTYSTFSYETIALLRDAQYFYAASNVILTTLLCLVGAWLGLELGQYLSNS